MGVDVPTGAKFESPPILGRSFRYGRHSSGRTAWRWTTVGCRRSRSECGRLWAAPPLGWTHCLNGIGAEDDGAGVTDPSAVVAVNQTRTPLGVGPVMSRRPVGARLLASSLSDQVDAVGRSRINASGGRGCFGRAARDEPPCAPMKGLPRESRSDSARPVRIPERDLASSSLAGIDMEDIVVGTTGRRFSHPGQLPDWSIGGHNAVEDCSGRALSITVTTTAAPAVAQVGRCDVIASVVAGKVGGGSFVASSPPWAPGSSAPRWWPVHRSWRLPMRHFLEQDRHASVIPESLRRFSLGVVYRANRLARTRRGTRWVIRIPGPCRASSCRRVSRAGSTIACQEITGLRWAQSPRPGLSTFASVYLCTIS